MGLLPWPERLIGAGLVTGARRRGSRFLLGGAFAVCAAPCIGPVLGSILVLAGDTGTAAEGALLLAVYGAGLSVPFVLAGALSTPMMGAFRWLRDHYTAIRVASGLTLVVLGALLFAGRFWWLRVYLNRALEWLGSTLSSTRGGSSASRATGGGTLPAGRRQRARRGVPPADSRRDALRAAARSPSGAAAGLVPGDGDVDEPCEIARSGAAHHSSSRASCLEANGADQPNRAEAHPDYERRAGC